MSTHRATSFVIVSGPKGTRRVNLTQPTGQGKVKSKGQVVWVDFSQFMQAVNLVGGPVQVTLAGIPCRYNPVGGLLQVVCKRKAVHGTRHGVNGRQRYNRSKVANCY